MAALGRERRRCREVWYYLDVGVPAGVTGKKKGKKRYCRVKKLHMFT